MFAYNFCRQAEHTRCIFTAFDQAGMTSALREPSSLRASPACPCPAPRHWAVLVPSTATGCQQVCWEVVAVGIPHLPDPPHTGCHGCRVWGCCWLRRQATAGEQCSCSSAGLCQTLLWHLPRRENIHEKYKTLKAEHRAAQAWQSRCSAVLVALSVL